MIDLDPPPLVPDVPPAPFFHREPLIAAAVLCALVLGAFVIIGSPVQLLNLAAGVWFTELVIFCGLSFALLQVFGSDPVRETGLDSTTPRAVVLGFALGLVNYLAWAIPLMAGVEKVLPKWLLEVFNGAQIFKHLSGVELVLVVAGLGLAAPFAEEFFFRGVVQKALSARLPPPRAIVVTALIFSAFHLDPVGFLARFELGVLFGLLAWRSGSIWPGVAAHAANNLLATALFFASSEQSADTDVPVWALLACLAGGNLLLIGLARFSFGKLRSPRPAERHDVPPLSVARAAAPWLLASLVILGLAAGLDWRGAELRLFELANPPPKMSGLKAALEDPALEPLRVKARRGEVPMEAYFDAWRARNQAPSIVPGTLDPQ